MKNTFKQYHQFTEKEFKKLWENCLFVFDTNTLLNMYRYSRKTVEAYFEVLEKIKAKKQLWTPYQIGYEFYENRIDVISEYESSYDSILSILEKAKKEMEESYKNHPFLDLCDIKKKMEKGLDGVEKEIKKAKEDHPKWMEQDDVLDKINSLFEDSIGIDYDEKELIEIKKEGKERYEQKVPPGYKDDKKPEDKKYGDLILWYQIIDKAKKSKKPIILISGDVKEDWWLEKNDKRIMPLPQLKKEIFEKAEVDFHIYTADRFLEYYDEAVDESAISEVRTIRELEEKRMMTRNAKMMERYRELSPRIFEKYSMEYVNLFEKLERLFMEIDHSKVHLKYSEELGYVFHRLKRSRDRIMHGDFDRKLFHKIYVDIKEFFYIFDKITHSEDIDPELSIRIREFTNELEHLNHRLRTH